MKAQIQFGESIMVVIIIVFLLMVGIVFYANVAGSGLKKEVRYREDVDALSLVKTTLAMPELQCTGPSSEGCVDTLRVQALATLITSAPRGSPQRAYYDRLFGYARISVHTVMGTTPALLLYDDLPSGRLEQIRQFYFVTLHDPVTNTNSMAYLNVTLYRRVNA